MRRTPRAFARLTALALTVSMAGCSFVFVDGPPANHAQLPSFRCTSSRVVPVLDAVFTGLETVNFALALTRSDMQWDELYRSNPPFSRTKAIGIYAVLAAIGGAGTVYGFTKVGSCRHARADQDEAYRLRMQQPAQPPPLPAVVPAPPPPVEPAVEPPPSEPAPDPAP